MTIINKIRASARKHTNMNLHIDTFEQAVDPVILQRGRSYFRNGHITQFDENEGEVTAVVHGTGNYKVRMEIDDSGNILSHSCTCPYDWGDICKHEVAVLYQLRKARKEADRKKKVDNIVEDMLTKTEKKSSATQTKATKIALYDPHLTKRTAGSKLPDEMFADLPKDDFDKQLLAMCLVHDGKIYSGYLSRIAKSTQRTGEQVKSRLNILVKKEWLQKEGWFDYYYVPDRLILELAMYLLDRRPEWLATEIVAEGQLKAHWLAFWICCAALYDGETDFLKRQKGVNWIEIGTNVLVAKLEDPYFEPLLHTIVPEMLYPMAVDKLDKLLLNEKLSEDSMQRIKQVVDTYGMKIYSNNSIYFRDYFATLGYLLGGDLPQLNKYSSEWAHIAHAISAMHHNEWAQAGKLFESALKIRNPKSRDKNLFNNPLACYYLMVYYAKRGTQDTKTKVEQYLRKEIAKADEQLPAFIVAKYVALTEDDGNCMWHVGRLLLSEYPLMHAFARLFADFFKLDIGAIQPTNIPLLNNDPLLFSIHVKSQWEKALDELLSSTIVGDASVQAEEQKNEERMAYVIEDIGDKKNIYPRKQKRCKDGSWSQPGNVSAQKYFTTGYDFMDDIDRQIFEHLRKMVGHTKYYSNVNWGTLADYLPYLADTDRVLLLIGRNDYLPVEVRKERAYLTIERKGEKLVFTSNIQLNKYAAALQSPFVIEESPSSYRVIELSDYEQKAYGILLRLGSMPQEAEPKLRQLISAVSNRIEIHSDMIEGGSTLEKILGDTTIVLRLAPKKGDFTLECCVQPLQGGKLRFFPGQGKRTIFDEKDGTRYQVERDIQLEHEHLQMLNEFAENNLHILLTPEPQMIALEDVLALMEFVAGSTNSKLKIKNSNSEAYVIEWQEGAKLNIKQPANEDSYSMGLRTRQNWFEVEGELQLDEQTILSAAELLRLMQGTMVGKRFVRLNDSEFIALNERLAKQLSRVQQLARIQKNSVIIPRYEISLLGELMANPETILREDKGVRELLSKIAQAATMTFPVPQGLQARLRDYQEEGFRWMMRLAEWGAGACLADDMGLGKTVQTIAVLLAKADKGASLVVAPASVLYNWQSEIGRFAPTLNAHILNEADDRRQLISSLGAYDVLLTTYGLLVREEKTLTDKPWNIICLDEAHTIKNRATKMSQAAMCLRADMRIALTGTPLQNYLSELWNLFQFINPGLLGSYEAFSHDFITPIEAEGNKQRQKLLRKILQPFLLRRTKAEVIDELPDKTEITRRIELSPDERVAYEAMRIEAEQQVAQATKVDMNVLASITRLRQAACSLELVQNGAPLSADGGSKLADFTELISQIVAGGNRVLVFSQFTSFLRMAQQAVSNQQSAVSSFYLDGATPLAKRKQMVEAFQHGEAQVFFISLKAGGLGLNLTAANYVIHLDPWWNPAIEQQATDRAYRIGQKQNVTVYHLIAADTIEEKILRLHKTKRDLADALLQDQNTTHALTLADLKDLLSASRE